jgi:carboxypeptidase Taq
VNDAYERLAARLTELRDIDAIARVLGWDQQTLMPPAGAQLRAEHLALLERLGHEQLISDETGRLLDEVRDYEASLDPDDDDAASIRVARRDYEKARRVPSELAEEMALVGSQALAAWAHAKATSDFASFLPWLERNVELRLRYVDCFDATDEPYDILLDDFEPETSTADVRALFEEIKAELVPGIASLAGREIDDSFLTGDFPPDRQERLGKELVALLGMREHTWRLDPTEHPFASGAGIDDIRITTHYHVDTLESIFSVVHEFGHGLYEAQLPRHLARLPVGQAVSLGMHESQSRLWENLVGRGLPFWRMFYPRLQETFPEQLGDVDLERFYAGINRASPSLIRIQADEVTYGMHVILRFELEQELINRRLAVRDVPEAWNAKMKEYLGVDVPDDAHGVLQDMHWAVGMIGYFPTYLLGSVMAVQLWQQILEDVPDLEEQIEQGEFAALREWLEEHVHRHGRRYPPQELLRRAVGSTIDAGPYLAYLREKYDLGVAV